MRAITLLLVGATLAGAADHREFRDIVDAISDHYRVQPRRIPFMGLVNTVAFFARPAGARHLDLAIFDDLRGPMDPDVIRRLVGREWSSFVQVYSRRPGRNETTLVYIRPEGRSARLLIANLESSEAVVVQLKLDTEKLREWLHDPERSARGEH